MIRIPVEKVPQGLEMCIASAKSFVRDAELIVDNNSSHATGILVFALEELGKAKMLRDKSIGLNAGQEIIFLTRTGCRINEFFDHETKYNEGISLLSNPDSLIVSSGRFGRARFGFSRFGQPDISVSHETRMNSFYVDFKNNEWKYDFVASPLDVKTAINEVKTAIDSFSTTI